MGARAYVLIDLVLDELDGAIIEIGSDRGEGSTEWFSDAAKRLGKPFISIDIDPNQTEKIRSPDVDAITGDGAEVLSSLPSDFASFVYLDNFDWTPPGLEHADWIKSQRDHYENLGLKMNNANCQLAHLEQARRLPRVCRDHAFVLIDDTHQDCSRWIGKGGLAVPFLQDRGFKIRAARAGFVLLER